MNKDEIVKRLRAANHRNSFNKNEHFAASPVPVALLESIADIIVEAVETHKHRQFGVLTQTDIYAKKNEAAN